MTRRPPPPPIAPARPPSPFLRWVLLGSVLLGSAAFLASPGSAGAAAVLEGTVRDQGGAPVRDAVVYLPEAGAVPAPAIARQAAMDQEKRTFVPLALVVRVGAEIRFPNSEAIHHSVYSFSRAKRFEIGLFKGQGGNVTLDRPGEVKVFCNIHKSMGALIVVVGHPYAAVTDAEGRFALRGLPAGEHLVRAAHVFALGTTRRVHLGSEPARADFTLTVGQPRGDDAY